VSLNRLTAASAAPNAMASSGRANDTDRTKSSYSASIAHRSGGCSWPSDVMALASTNDVQIFSES
jgi:hypothetical protein